MELESLGYIGIRARDLNDWAQFGTTFLGMQLVDRSRSTLTLRMDDRRQRVVVQADGGEGAKFFGWEVADARARSTAWPRGSSRTLSPSIVCPRRRPTSGT